MLLSKRLQCLIIAEGEKISSQIKSIVLKIRKLVLELSRVYSLQTIRRIMGSAAFLIGLSFTNNISAQTFAPPITNPFDLDSLNLLAFPAFADLDNDGDLDLMAGEYMGNMEYFENKGTSLEPSFAFPKQNPFGLTPSNVFAVPTIADIDDDGDLDLMVGEYYGSLRFYENIGSAGDPQFGTPQINPFGLDSLYFDSFPAFVDLDGDGDFDLMVGEYQGNLQYFENTGTPLNPQFSPPQENPFGLTATYVLSVPAFADLDLDGDLDLIVGEYYGNFQYFENTGNANNPQFASPVVNPFGLVPVYYFSFPSFADIDNDGDIDLLAGEYYGGFKFFENKELTGVSNLAKGVDVKIYPNPAGDVFFVDAPEKVTNIKILNLFGEKVKEINNPGNRISISDLKRSIYMVKITFSDGIVTIKKLNKI